jgi:hypothetical protein
MIITENQLQLIKESAKEEQLITEMATIGKINSQNILYTLSVHSDKTAERESPHIHVIAYQGKSKSTPNIIFNLEFSLVDLLTKDQWTILLVNDKKRHYKSKSRTTDWRPYNKLLEDVKTFLFSGPFTFRGAQYIDHLDYAIAQWNLENDWNAAMNNENVLMNWMSKRNLTVLPKYLIYFRQ